MEDVTPVKGLYNSGPMCELSGSIEIITEDGTEFPIQCTAVVAGNFATCSAKYADRHVQGNVMTGSYFSNTYMELYLNQIKVLNESTVCN